MTFGWLPAIAHWLKGWIRRKLIVDTDIAPIGFRRECEFTQDSVILRDEVQSTKGIELARLRVGGEFVVKHVPQSQYFQSQELQSEEWEMREESSSSGLKTYRLTRVVNPHGLPGKAVIESGS